MINQTISNLRSVWQQLNILKQGELKMDANLPASDVERMRQQMSDCLEAKGGDVSARAHAAKLGEAYLGLNDLGRRRFLKILAEDFAVDVEIINTLASEILATEQAEVMPSLHQKMRQALQPRSLALLTKFNSLPSA